MSNTPVYDQLMAMPGALERYQGAPPRHHSVWFNHVVNMVLDTERRGGDGVEALCRVIMNISDEKNASMRIIMEDVRSPQDHETT